MTKTKTKTKPASEGQPFFAARINGKLLRAFYAHARKAKTSPQALVREYMAKVTGVKVAADE